jgi:hypothetical protein
MTSNTPDHDLLSEIQFTWLSAVQQINLSRYQLVEVPPATADYRAIGFRLAVLTNEVRALQSEYEKAVTGVLGQARAGKFLARARPRLDTFLGPLPFVERTLKLTAQRRPDGRVTHTLETHAQGVTASSPIQYPLDPGSALWPFRYLFGEAPLLADQPAAANPAQ